MMKGVKMLNEIILTISEGDLSTILWVGGRYCWSDALLSKVDVGDNILSEEDIIALGKEFKKDTEGGHMYFPCLAPGPLYSSLSDIVNKYEEICEDLDD